MTSYHDMLRDALTRDFKRDGLDDVTAAGLAGMVASRTTLDAAGRSTRPVADIIAEVRDENADVLGAFRRPDAPKVADHRSPFEIEAAAYRARAGADRQARIDEIVRQGNPFAAGPTRNVTRACTLASLDPALAARLSAETRA